MRTPPPTVSVVIPAYNAATTLGETLDSLLAQKGAVWEAIVTDDGSTDATAAVAAAYAARDARIRVVRQAQQGESAARNTAIAQARHEWLLCLDSDDWLLPQYLERMAAALAADPLLDALHCGWSRVTPDGTPLADRFGPSTRDVFPMFARFNALAVHACVFRRSLATAVGGFDTSLRTCADWDFWQKVARTGARFGGLQRVLARYRMRPASASVHGERLLRDGLRVIARGHAPDPRVGRSHPAYAQGMPAAELAAAQLAFASWPAGLVLGSGQDARPLLDLLPGVTQPLLDPEVVAQNLFEALPLPSCQPPAAWDRFWPERISAIDDFLVALEAHAAAPGLARGARATLERLTLEHTRAPLPQTRGATHAIRLAVTAPVEDVRPPAPAERLLCLVEHDGRRLGSLELPVADGLVPATSLGDAVAERFAWTLLGLFFGHTLALPDGPPPAAGPRRARGLVVSWLHRAWAALYARYAPLLFSQESWGGPAAPHPAPSLTLPRAAPGGVWLAVDLAAPLPAIRDCGPALDVLVLVGGSPVDALRIPVAGGRLSNGDLRRAIEARCGPELGRAAAREAILGQALSRGETLSRRLTAAARARRHRAGASGASPAAGRWFAPGWTAAAGAAAAGGGGVVIGHRTNGGAGTSVFRHAHLPAAAAGEVLAAATAAGDPLLGAGATSTPQSVPGPILYAPDVIPLSRTAESGGGNPPTIVAAALRPPARTRGRLIRLAGRVLSHEAQRHRGDHPPATGTRGPAILAFSSVEADSAESRRSISPERLEAHLRSLHASDVRVTTLDEWRKARGAWQATRQRTVVLTFDDSAGFAEHAWPVLRQLGFPATVLLAPDAGDERPESGRADHAPGRLDAETVRRLQRQGVEFGARSRLRCPPAAAGYAELVRDAAEARAVLTRRLGAPIWIYAFPPGRVPEAVGHLIGGCGYAFGLTTGARVTELADSLLALPCIAIAGADSVERLAMTLAA